MIMITSTKLKMLTTYDCAGLALTLEASGAAKNVLFTRAVKFLGITNAGQFCYSVVHEKDNKAGKVFLTFDPMNNKVTASMVNSK